MRRNPANDLPWLLAVATVAAFAGLPNDCSGQERAPASPIFGRDVAPVLIAQCVECHDANRKSGGLSMATFETLREGGESGDLWVGAKSAESLIVRKLRGLDPPRMPRNRPPLKPETIERIAAWIEAGANLESGRKASEPLESLAWPESRIMAERLGGMSPEDRLAAAENEARRIYAAVRPASATADAKTVRTSARFAVIGIDDAKAAESLLKTLEQVADNSKSLFGEKIRALNPQGARFIVFIFDRPAEFAEFGRQNGFESLAAGENAVGRSGGSWPIMAVLANGSATIVADERKTTVAQRKGGKSSRRPNTNDSKSAAVRSVQSLAVEAFVEALFDEFPAAPAWLEAGLAVSFAGDFETNRQYFENLSAEALSSGPARVAGDWPRRAEDLLKDRLSAEASRPLAFALIDWLRRTWPADFPEFVQNLSGGESQLDNTIGKLWKTDRATFVASWTESLMRGPVRKGRR